MVVNDIVKCFFKEGLITESRATICNSDNRVLDYKAFFLVHPPGKRQKGTGLFLMASD